MHYPTKHVRLKFKGRGEAIQNFHRVLLALDKDWPYACRGHWPSEKIRRCNRCKGLTYKMPKFSIAEVMALAKRLKVIVKVRVCKDENDCQGMPGVNSFYIPAGLSKGAA